MFSDDGVYYQGEGPYPWTDEDDYAVLDDTGGMTIYFKKNVIPITGEFLEENAKGGAVMISVVCALTQE